MAEAVHEFAADATLLRPLGLDQRKRTCHVPGHDNRLPAVPGGERGRCPGCFRGS